MRVAMAGFPDETCTFCNEPTGINRFEPETLRGQSILEKARGIPIDINGFMTVLEAEGAHIVPLVYVRKTRGGFSSWLTLECFDKYTNEIADGLKNAGPLDGVLLALHGAMAVSGVPKPEAEMVRRARAAVGDVPIMVTLDLHANEDHELTDVADAVFVIKTYPHVDSQQTGEIAARCMVDTIRGKFSPAQSLVKVPLVSASIYQASDLEPMKPLYDRCRYWEQSRGVYCASVAPGYAYADVPDIGMSVITVTNAEKALAEVAARDIADLAWSLKEQFVRPLPKPREGVAEIMRLLSRGQRRVVIADGADRIGDTTHVLKELLAQGARNWAMAGIADPNAISILMRHHKVGDIVSLDVGGWYGGLSGEPVPITGTIEYLDRPNYILDGPRFKGHRVQEGPVARVNLGDNRHVVISEGWRRVLDSSGLTAVGLDVESLQIIVFKERVHHRAYWDSHALNVPIDAPGIGVADVTQLEYHNVPDDVFPIGRKWRERERL